MIMSSEIQGNTAVIEGEVPLAETFGYSTDLRSMTQGQGTFTMEFSKYRRVPNSIQQEIIEEKKKQLVGAK
jgi:elongation factor G